MFDLQLKPMKWIQRNLTGCKISTSAIKFVFSGRSEKQDGRPASDWLKHFRLLLWTEFNETWQDAISQCPLQRFCFRADRKTRWPLWPLIDWDILDFSSETAERNSTTLDRKQDLNVLYQVCVFRTDRKSKMAAPMSDWLIHFRLLLW